MHTRFIPRLLLVALMFALAAVGSNGLSADASERTEWPKTTSEEDVLVQSCYDFNITGSYTADRVYQVVENYYTNQVFERQHVTFTGALGYATAGEFFAYDGQYTRTADYRQGGEVIVSDLKLRLEPGTLGEFAVSIPLVDFDLADNPRVVVEAIVLNVLEMDLCQLFGSSTIVHEPIMPSSHPTADLNAGNIDLRLPAIHTENSALRAADIETTQDWARSVRSKLVKENAALTQQAEAEDDDMTSWTELDPCDSSPPGKPC